MTNAAYRTTPGSGDLRRADFAGSAERLERIARELRPRWLAFVGKEAYRGAFGTRPELGLQERTLGDTKLFVLPSTSPANAAVPWDERLRWFRELAGRESGLPERQNDPRRGRRRTGPHPAPPLRRRIRATGGSRPAAAARQERPTSKRSAASSRRRSASSGSSSARCSGSCGAGRSAGARFRELPLPRLPRSCSLASSRRISPRRTRLAGSRPAGAEDGVDAAADLAERLSSASDS